MIRIYEKTQLKYIYYLIIVYRENSDVLIWVENALKNRTTF